MLSAHHDWIRHKNGTIYAFVNELDLLIELSSLGVFIIAAGFILVLLWGLQWLHFAEDQYYKIRLMIYSQFSLLQRILYGMKMCVVFFDLRHIIYQ